MVSSTISFIFVSRFFSDKCAEHSYGNYLTYSIIIEDTSSPVHVPSQQSFHPGNNDVTYFLIFGSVTVVLSIISCFCSPLLFGLNVQCTPSIITLLSLFYNYRRFVVSFGYAKSTADSVW